MSDLLVEWIAKTVEDELREGLRWRESITDSTLRAGRVGDLAIEDDGTNLRLKSLKPRIVQIIKVGLLTAPMFILYLSVVAIVRDL